VSTECSSLFSGAEGVIGSNVVEELLARAHTVVALDELSCGFESAVKPSARFVRGSILNEPLVVRLFEKWKFDYVFHLAAYAVEGLSHFIRRSNYTNNLLGSINLIKPALQGCELPSKG
jgi:UDP-glucose 4-epimerase